MNPKTKLFIRWWVHQLRTFDCDPAIVAMKYIINRMELNIEQRYWFCFLYANTYQLPTAWVLFNEFPDYENVPQARIEAFSRENIGRLPYQKDQKWLRGNLGQTFKSYRENLSYFKQADWFALCQRSNGINNFTELWVAVLKGFYKFGRYTAWFYLQALKEVCGLALEPTSLMLSFDSSRTHRQGLCLALGLPTETSNGVLDASAAFILDIVRTKVSGMNNLPVQPDYFSMETSLCSFKKLFRLQQGRYLGYYHDRFSEDIMKTTGAMWPGINWKLFWDFREECLLPQMRSVGLNQCELLRENKWKQSIFLSSGDTFHDDPELMAKLDSYIPQL